MSWNYERSKERLAKEWERLQVAGIRIEKLKREMDLTNLSPTEARLVHGVHFYANIHNFEDLLEDDLMRRDNFKRFHRYMHVARVEQRRIMQSVFDGDKIQVQGPKFHGLLFKPYDDASEMAWRSVLAGVAFCLMFKKALPQVFEEYLALTPTVGLELGHSIVANIGVRGDRELISVGSPANHAAKIMGGANTITIGENLFSSLAKEHKPHFLPDGAAYRLAWSGLKNPEELIRDEGFDWSVTASVTNMQGTVESLRLEDIIIEEAREKINLDRLGPKHAKTCSGASIFADIDGYTKLVDSLGEDLEELGKAVQLLHLFRYELRQVTQSDFDGITIQHQGDRLQALLHLPRGDNDRIKEKAVELCISYNTSVEELMNKEHNVLGELHVATGCDFGKALVGRLGVRGDLDASCLGDATAGAEHIQLDLKGNEIGIDPGVYEAIRDESIKAAFAKDKETGSYVAKGVTWVSLEDAERARAYASSSKAAYTSAGTIAVGNKVSDRDRPVKVTRPWSE